MTVYGDIAAFSCSENNAKITAIDPSHNTELTLLNCSKNSIRTLDVSKNTGLTMFGFWGNNLTTATIDTIYCQLPNRTGKSQKGLVFPLLESSSAAEQNLVKATNSKNATDKNWRVMTYKDNNTHVIVNTIGVYTCMNTDIAEVSKEQPLTFYPNPVADVLYLSATARTIHIYNIYGIEVARATDTDKVEVSHLPAGVYTVKADGTVAKMVKR